MLVTFPEGAALAYVPKAINRAKATCMARGRDKGRVKCIGRCMVSPWVQKWVDLSTSIGTGPKSESITVRPNAQSKGNGNLK